MSAASSGDAPSRRCSQAVSSALSQSSAWRLQAVRCSGDSPAASPFPAAAIAAAPAACRRLVRRRPFGCGGTLASAHSGWVWKRGAGVAVGLAVLGVEVDGLAVLGDGIAQFALVLEGTAEVVVGKGILGVEVDGLAILGAGLVQLAPSAQNVPEAVVGRGIL